MSSVPSQQKNSQDSDSQHSSNSEIIWEELSTLENNSEVFIVRWSLNLENGEQQFIDFSDNITLLGLDPENLHLRWSDIVHVDDKHQIADEIRQAAELDLGEYNVTYRIKPDRIKPDRIKPDRIKPDRIKADNDYIWIRDNANFKRDPIKSIVYFQSVIIDISHIKNTEIELERKNTYLNLLHDTAVSLAEHQDIETTLNIILNQLSQLSKHTDAYIALKNEDETLSIVAATGIFKQLIKTTKFDKSFGAMGKIWQTNQALYIEDYQKYPQRAEKHYTEKIQSVAGFPLSLNGEFRGILGYTSRKKLHFTDELKDIHTRFAQLVSLALDNSQIHNTLNTELIKQKELEEQLREEQSSFIRQVQFRTNLSELIEKSLAGDDGHGNDSFYQMILDSAIQGIAGAEAGSLLVRQRDNKFHFTAVNNYNFEALKDIVLEEGELHFDATSSSPMLTYNVDNSDLENKKQEGLDQNLSELQVSLSIPIHNNDKLIALINIDNFYDKTIFTEETVHLAQVFSRHIAALWKRFDLEQVLSDQMLFRSNMAQLVETSLASDLTESFYQTLLEGALNVLPDAEGGSLLVKTQEGMYRTEAAIGHDLALQQQYLLRPNQLYRDISIAEPMRFVQEEIDTKNQKNDLKQTEAPRRLMVILSIPIHVNGEAVAMFNIDNFSSYSAFSEDTLHQSKIFANQISALWQRFTLEKELQSRELQYKSLFEEATYKTNELSLLDELQKAISSQLELTELFNVSLEKISEIFGYSFSYIRILDGEHLRLVASYGFQESLLPELVSSDHAIAQKLIEEKQLFYLNPDSYEQNISQKTNMFGTSTMLLPILVNSEFWGFMGIGYENQELYDNDFALGQKVVELMSVAIENAQLHAQVKRDLRRNESLHKISQAVQQYDNLEELMDNIVKYIREAMNARWAMMYKINTKESYIESVSTTEIKDSPLQILDFEEVTSGLGGWAIDNKQVAFTPKGVIDDRESPELSQRIIDLKIGSVAVIPFIHDGKVEGTIAVINHMDDPDFSKNDLKLLDTVANQVAAAISKHKLMRQIEHQAYHDALTNLPNRVQFESDISAIIQKARRRKLQFAVLFIDLDGFKYVNDTLGHALGDELLIRVAERIQSRKRQEDILARMGGDEFALILSSVDNRDNALKIANDYLKFFLEPYDINGHTVTVGASIGVSLYPNDGNDIQTLLSNADSAMYQAKNSGKNNVSGFTESLAQEVKERTKIEQELKLALERDELELHYQPQYNIYTQEIIGLEALVRWRHPKKGLISPGTFIPIAEETNLIIDLGNWVLYEACRQNAKWQTQGHPPLCVAVNISAKQFAKNDFVDTVVSALKMHSLDAKYLELEVTESVVMSDIQTVIERLELLQTLNINISIDDFGTGYSSLTYLQDLPLDKLKIDKSFVDKLETTANPAIIKTVITLGQSLGLTTIAEGVETEDQLKILHDLGCDEAQGYYFAKPLPVEEVFTNTPNFNVGTLVNNMDDKRLSSKTNPT